MSCDIEIDAPTPGVGPNQLLITKHANGRVTVEGPLVNRNFCYGLLEEAKDAIREFKPQSVLPVSGNLLLAQRRGNG